MEFKCPHDRSSSCDEYIRNLQYRQRVETVCVRTINGPCSVFCQLCCVHPDCIWSETVEWRRLRRAAELNGAPLTVKPCEQTPSSGWLTNVTTGVANAWSFITDEAALADVQAPPPSVPRPRPTVSLDLSLTGLPLPVTWHCFESS